MTALDALHGGTPLGPEGEGSAWPDAAEGDAGELSRQAPLPVPAQPPGIVTEDGTRLVAGLDWETASGPEAPALRADTPPVLRLPERRARLADADGSPCGSLLLALAAGLARLAPKASGPWAFMAEIPEPEGPPHLWMAVADIVAPDDGDAGTDARATPRPGPEWTFDDADEALAALQGLLAVTDVAGIAVSWTPIRRGMSPEDTHRGRVIQGLADIAPAVPLHDVDPVAGTPIFVPARQVPVRLLGGLGILGLAVLAGAFVVLPMIEEALRPDPVPAPEMATVRVAPGAFATACAAALDAWWPRVSGWEVSWAGCAVAGNLPEDPGLPEPPVSERLVESMVAWRHLEQEGGRNAVLARGAARQMIRTWPHEARLDDDSLTLWRTEPLPVVAAHAPDQEDGAPPHDPDAVADRLATLFADAPDGVTRGGDSRPNLFTVRAPGTGTAAAVLSRAVLVPGITPVRFVRSAEGGTELVLAPVAFREVRASLLEPKEGEREQ